MLKLEPFIFPIKKIHLLDFTKKEKKSLFEVIKIYPKESFGDCAWDLQIKSMLITIILMGTMVEAVGRLVTRMGKTMREE